MTAPTKIEIKSDGNCLELVDLVKGVYTYKYISSISKKGELLKLSEVELIKLLKVNS